MIDVFAKISAKQVEGVMRHAQWADLFDFCDLCGEKRWQEYRAMSEFVEMRGVHRYAINHCNKMLPDTTTSVRLIPNDWYNATRFDVTENDRKDMLKRIYTEWFNWEKSVKAFYEEQFKLLTDNKCIASANKVMELIKDVDEELKVLTRKMLEYKAVGWDIGYIMYQQPEMHEHYAKKQMELGVCIC